MARLILAAFYVRNVSHFFYHIFALPPPRKRASLYGENVNPIRVLRTRARSTYEGPPKQTGDAFRIIKPDGQFRYANILRLAAASQAGVALRRECEPDSSAVHSSAFDSWVDFTKRDRGAKRTVKPDGQFRYANILRLAAASQAGIALRRECEPDSSAMHSSVFDVRRSTKTNRGCISHPLFVLVEQVSS